MPPPADFIEKCPPPRCECGCGRPLIVALRGREKHFVTPACRKRVCRRRGLSLPDATPMVRKGGRYPLSVRLRFGTYWLPSYAPLDRDEEMLEPFMQWWMPDLVRSADKPPTIRTGGGFESEPESDPGGDYVLIYRGGRYVALGERHRKQSRWHIERPARLKETHKSARFRTAQALVARVQEIMTSPGFIDYGRPMITAARSSYLHAARRTWPCDGNKHGPRAPECSGEIYESELYFARTRRWGQHTCQPCALALYPRMVRRRPLEPAPTFQEQMQSRADRWWSRSGIHVRWLPEQERNSELDSYPSGLVSTELAVRIGSESAFEMAPVPDVFRVKGDSPKPWRVRGEIGEFRTAVEAMNTLKAVREFVPPVGFRLTNDGRSKYSLGLAVRE